MYLLISSIMALLFIIMLIKFNIIDENKSNIIELNELNNTSNINLFKKLNNNEKKKYTKMDNMNNVIDADSTLNKKKYYKKTNKYPKCLEFEKNLINKINKILDNTELKTKQIVEKLDNNYKIKISKKDLNKGVLKWMLCRKLLKYNEQNFTYLKK
jgi:hypothetical protein